MTAYMSKRMKPRRRREGRTDYRKRVKLVKSGLERLVIRRTNRRLIVQLVKSKLGGDETLLTVTSDVLVHYSWKASFKSTPAAYLTGLLLGKKALENGFKKAILDIGVQRSVKGLRLYAVVKGVLDAGMEVPVSEEMLPDELRLVGKHITNYYLSTVQTPGVTQFCGSDGEYLQNLAENVMLVKEKILKGGGNERMEA
ncbi:MAG: 50S ribosomal protein L18 [Candidatus Caldarchaeum sp.]